MPLWKENYYQSSIQYQTNTSPRNEGELPGFSNEGKSRKGKPREHIASRSAQQQMLKAYRQAAVKFTEGNRDLQEGRKSKGNGKYLGEYKRLLFLLSSLKSI